MKITDIQTYLVHSGRQNWIFVKVLTDKGIHGWGEASVEGQEKAVEESIKVLATRSVIGEDPENIERIWQKMYRHGFWKGGFIYMSAISGIDQALWDILGKMYNVPTYKLLGGAVRDKVRSYTHAFNAESSQRAMDLGFDGVKVGGGGGRVRGIYDPDHAGETLDNRLAEVRATIGPDKALCIDNHGQSAPSVAIAQMVAAAKHNTFFFEEPIPPENTMAYKRLRDHGPSVPLAAGERLFSRFEYREVVENQLFDIVQPDICHCGGITEIRKIASYVEPYHIRFAPHNPNGPVASAASLHVCASTQHFDILEFSSGVFNREDIFTGIDLHPKDGYFAIPDGPGLGIELNEEAFAKYPYQDQQYHPIYKADGSVAEI